MNTTIDKPPSITVDALDSKVNEYFDLLDKKDDISADLKECNKALAKLDAELIGHFKEHNKDKVGYATERGKLSVRLIESVTMPKTLNDKMELFTWLRERELFDTYATINSQSLNALFREEKEKAVESNPAEAMTFSLPGIEAPKIFEKIKMMRGKKK